ncbi:MAG: hydroxymethylbilane synthase [Desulfamplus sp.]|nr:hydroxymethylbilane synthase [Desulfamplus sp.]
MTKTIKIGTRGSQLALWQANWVKSEIEKILDGLYSSNPVSIPQIEIVKIKTTGDQITDRPLSMVGGKGLFVKEIEQQLLDNQIDIAVHSMKDMPADLPDGLIVGATPVRANPFDVIISRGNLPLDRLPSGAKIGTSSLRRASQIKHFRPDVNPISIRGNLDTRLRKLDTGEYDAIILAAAGLIRLGMSERVTQYLDEDTMVPAVGQGALCIESRQNDEKISHILAKLDDLTTRLPVEAERAFLKKMEGSCHIPVACFGKFINTTDGALPSKLTLTGLVASEDGAKIIKEKVAHSIDKIADKNISEQLKFAQNIGNELADQLLNKGGKEILESLK